MRTLATVVSWRPQVAIAGRFRYEKGMKRARILVVDDDADIRDLLRELFERAGYEGDGAADGRAGLRALYATAPDVVLLDVSMPDLDGWQTLERIRAPTA